jgi:hypothetical protein
VSDELEIAVVEVGSTDGAADCLETARDRLAAALGPDATVRLRDARPPDAVTAEPTVDPETRLADLRDRIGELVGADGVAALSDEERTRLDSLREEYHFYDELAETSAEPVRVPALRVTDADDPDPDAVAAAVVEPLGPLAPETLAVAGEVVSPVTATALADAVAAATDGG